MRRRSWTGEVVNFVYLDVQRPHNVVMNELKILVTQPMFNVSFPARKEIVYDNDFVAGQH
jgi:hypothetical protein